MKPETVGMSSARLARLDEVMTAPLCRQRLPARHADLRLPQGPARPHRHVRPDGPGARPEDARGRDLPHLFDVEADHRGGADDAGRGGPDRPRRPRPDAHPGMAGPRGLCQRHAVAAGRCAAELSDDPGPAADEGRRPGDPHLRSDLRLHDAHRGRHRLPPGQGDRPPDRRWAPGHGRPAGPDPARFLAGHGVELFGVDRRVGVSRRKALRPELRRVSAHAACSSRSA